MRKNFLNPCFSLIIFFFLFFIFPQTINAFNLITNPGFEIDNEGWKINNSSVSLSFVDEEAYEGSKSAKISNPKIDSYGIEQIIKNINPSSIYRSSSYLKLISPYPKKAFLRLAWYQSSDTSGPQISTDDSPYATDSSDWQKIEIIKSPPPNALSLKIRLLVSSGSAYFDDVFFEEYIPTPTPTPTPTSTPQPTPRITAEQPSPTPTSFPSPIPSSSSPALSFISYDNIYLSEVMVYPQIGEKEWVEIYNDNDYPVFLKNWYLDDLENAGSSPKSFSLEIAGKDYAVLELSSSMFNNDGDNIRLLDFNKILKDSFEYNIGEKGKTFGRVSFDNDEFCLQEPSKGFINNPCLNPTNTPTSKLENTLTPSKTPIPSKTPTPTKAIINKNEKIPSWSAATGKISPLSEEIPGEILGMKNQLAINSNQDIISKKSLVYAKSFTTSSFLISLLNIFYLIYKIIKKLNY